jgi:hypothetical protein
MADRNSRWNPLCGTPACLSRFCGQCLVYGPGATGNFAALTCLASSRLPLPFGLFHKRRSLPSHDNLIAAVQFVVRDGPILLQNNFALHSERH